MSWFAGRRYRRIAVAVAIVIAGMSIISKPVPARPQSAIGWKQLTSQPNGPPARAQYGMTSNGAGSIYVYGGRGSNGILGDFWNWSKTTATWLKLDNNGMPDLVEPHLVEDSSGNVYEFGGIGSSTGAHFSEDGHSSGLYKYNPALNQWTDITDPRAAPGVSWPLAREDHGFAYDPVGNAFWVFAGEGPGTRPLNDMWRYDIAAGTWQQIQQTYSAPSSATIDPREIYQISYDGHGGFYLFGGADLLDVSGQPVSQAYVNDLWRFEITTRHWSLLAGRANQYDPRMPIPRHYYGQASDVNGNFYILGGFSSDSNFPPYFDFNTAHDVAQLVVFEGSADPSSVIMYAMSDFWEFNARQNRWSNLGRRLGDLTGEPFIPYNMVADTKSGTLLTFGGYHMDGNVELALSSGLWSYKLPPTADHAMTNTAQLALSNKRVNVPVATPPISPGRHGLAR
ncbi:MAG: Ig-like, group 2 [Chloroflexi bacterium]|nr:Ig-like, group 2 [Chloroflexota bacterium]